MADTSTPHKPLLVTVVATPQTGTAGTFIIMDLLAAVGLLWETLHGEAPQLPRFLPRLVTVDGKPYRDFHGVLITPHGAIADFPQPDIVMVPELAIGPFQAVDGMAPLAEWIRAAYQGGAMVASLC